MEGGVTDLDCNLMYLNQWFTLYIGGERGIRTPEARFRRLHTFQACSFNHSDTSPRTRATQYSQPDSRPFYPSRDKGTSDPLLGAFLALNHLMSGAVENGTMLVDSLR